MKKSLAWESFYSFGRVIVLLLALVSEENLAWSCMGGRAVIPLKGFGALQKLAITGSFFEIEGRSFSYDHEKKTWCENSGGSCAQVFPVLGQPDRKSAVYGFCEKSRNQNFNDEICHSRKPGRIKGDNIEYGFLSFSSEEIVLVPTIAEDEKPLLITIKPGSVNGYRGLVAEAFEGNVKGSRISLGQKYSIASNVDMSGEAMRSMKNKPEELNPTGAFGGGGKFNFQGGCGGLKKIDASSDKLGKVAPKIQDQPAKTVVGAPAF